MSKKLILSVSCLLLLASACSNPTASVRATQPDVMKARTIMSCARAEGSGNADFLTQKPVDGGVRTVASYGGQRYTVDQDGYTPGVQVWVRPDGTSYPSVKAKAFTDTDTDGAVDRTQYGKQLSNAERAELQQQYNLLLAGLRQSVSNCVDGKRLDAEVRPSFDSAQLVSLMEAARNAPDGFFVQKKPVEGGWQAVFVEGGRRWTLQNNVYTPGVQVWVRPDGTSYPSVRAETLSDTDADGVADAEPLKGNPYGPRYDKAELAYQQQQYNELLFALKAKLG